QVEPSLLADDALEEETDLLVVGVVAADGDSGAAARRQLLGGVVDRAGTAERGRLAADAAAGDVDGRALLAEHERDPLAAAAARTGHERDLLFQSRSGHHGIMTRHDASHWRAYCSFDALTGRPCSC